MHVAAASLEPSSDNCTYSNASTSTSAALTTLILSIAEDTFNKTSNNSQRFANELTIIFGVTATILAFGSLVFGYLAWRVYKRPDRNESPALIPARVKEIVMPVSYTVVYRRKKRKRYGAGSLFEDGCVEMQDAATWKYYKGSELSSNRKSDS